MRTTEAHDPTASATRYPAVSPARTCLSQNEIETLCLKAARGAGMAWGMAEEAAFAAAWLSGMGIDGPSLLLRHLLKLDATGGIPVISKGQWTATTSGALCPIAVGVALDDRAKLDDGPCSGAVTIAAVQYPCLTVPFLWRMARAMHTPLRLEWDYGAVSIVDTGDLDNNDLSPLLSIKQCRLRITPVTGKASDRPPVTSTPVKMLTLSAATLGELNALAMRTTVPASDASRRGAGATTNDND